MDDDLFQFEPAKEAAPELVLGKKKKKKKKKTTDDNDDTHLDSSMPDASQPDDNADDDAPPALDLNSKKKKKSKSLKLPSLDDDEQLPDLDLGKKKKKKKKKDSSPSTNGHSSSFAALGDDNDNDDDEGNDGGDDGPSTSEATSAFAVLNLDDDNNDNNAGIDIATELLSKKKKKKKSKALALPDPVEADAVPASSTAESAPANESGTGSMFDAVDEAEQKRPMTAAEKKKAKKERERLAKLEKKKEEENELDAILAELDTPASGKSKPAVADEAGPSEPADDEESKPTLTAAQKKRNKKKKKAAAADDADEDAAEAQPETSPAGGGAAADDLLAEFGGGDDDAGAASKNKKKKKKKKGAAAATAAGEDDVDALLKEFGDVPPPATEDKLAPTPVTAGADDLLAELGGDIAADGDAAVGGKKKAKKKKKKGAAAKAEEAEGKDETAEAAPSAEAGKKKKKESAAVRKMREAQEKLRAQEELERKLKEEEEERIAAEERKKEEEAQRKAEEKARKKAAEKAKKERKKQDGTLLSKAEREKRRKAEAFKKQLMEKGMIPAALKKPTDSDNKQGDSKAGEAPVEEVKPKVEEPKPDDKKPDESEDKKEVSITVEEDKKVEEEPVLDDWDAEEEEEEQKQEEQVAVEPKKADKSVPKEEAKPTVEAKPKAISKPAVANAADDDSDEDDSDNDDSDDESDDDSDYEGMTKAEIATEKRIEAFRKVRAKQKQEAMAARSADKLRSPVICILGHVDTGKTKILDKIRRTNVQDGEAGGITQQIGATYFPIDAVKKEATKLDEGKQLSYNVPSLLIIDTPGHESFTNLRSRGSSLCDIAILVVDIMHGLEPQTRESIDLLKLRKTPFVVALNKIDRIYDWKAQPHNCPSRKSIDLQPNHAREEFHRRVQETKLQFAEIGFNTELYWENTDVRRYVSLVPTSAISGEGIPDLLMLLLALPQRLLTERLMFKSILEATVLEVKVIEGLGTTIDIILTGGTIREGDTIVAVGLDGPITATIRALLTPHPMKEMRVKGQYLHHKEIEAAQGVKISADGLEKVVAGTQIMVVEDPNNEEEMEFALDEVMQDFQTILTNVDKSGEGVYVQASTLGSLEALLEFLRTSKIAVSGINIGPVHKRDVTKASTMLERRKEYATILAFDVIVEREARDLADEVGVRIFTADIIYHLFDQFTAYMEQVRKARREAVNDDVVFPSISKILPQHIYNKKDPIVVGVDVMEGILRVGTPLVVNKGGQWLDVGRVASLELNKKQVNVARKGESVALKIQDKSTENIMYGRHFDFQDALVSKMSRNAIDLLKESFKEDLTKEDWRLVVKLKKMFNIL